MLGRDKHLIAEIESDALDENVSVANALRKCIVLGGKSGSEKLRDWATLELKGYYGDEELPDYRIVPAPLYVDAVTMTHKITGQQFPPSGLPDFAQEHIKEIVELREGVGGLEAFLKQAEIKLQPRMSSDLVRLMNSKGDPSQQIISLYWNVSHAAIAGVLDQIRTSLTQLVGELRATMPGDETIPSAEAADQAVHVIATGERARVHVNAAQAGGAGATATTSTGQAEESPGFWTPARRVGAFVVGLATVVGTVVVLIEAL